MLKLFIIRGLPGSGKTTLAHTLTDESLVFSADDFFVQPDGSYQWDPSKLPEAHADCLRRTREAIQDEILRASPATPNVTICVTNVFARREHYAPYEALIYDPTVVPRCSFEARAWIIDLYDQGCSDEILALDNVHKVPEETIAAMRRAWEK